MIQVRELKTAAEVYANAKRLRSVFYGSRQAAPAQVITAPNVVAVEPDLFATTRQEYETFPANHDSSEAASTPPEVVTAADLLAQFKQVTLRHVYGDETVDDSRRISMGEIRGAVMREFHVSRIDLESERRTHAIVIPRQALMYLLNGHTTHSLPTIGRFLGGKDHTTVLHGIKACAKRMQSDPAYKARIEAIELLLAATSGAAQ